ncbi:hypothetical protein ACLOJK_031078 [Asimina triloba]
MTKVPMGPPPPRTPQPPPPILPPADDSSPQQQQQLTLPEESDSERQREEQPQPDETTVVSDAVPETEKSSAAAAEEKPSSVPSSQETPTAAPSAAAVPYTIPPWSDRPPHHFSLEVLKDGAIIDELDLSQKGAYMFGRIDLCDFVLEHPTVSRFHTGGYVVSVMASCHKGRPVTGERLLMDFNSNGDAFLYDLDSTHGTFVNKNQCWLNKTSAKLLLLLKLPGPFAWFFDIESDLTLLRNAKTREEVQDREASLLRARVEASLADGISWGMAEDAVEDTTEVSNMKKEIDAIRVKDISQGGLTQGQQMQIARNEQRISQLVTFYNVPQIMEELDNLEETLNESIQESIGARARKSNYGKGKGCTEDEDEVLSDDDDFYDRTKKKKPSKQKNGEKSIETADTLLDKKEAISKEIDEKNKLLLMEKTKTIPDIEGGSESGDVLDAYMTGLSSQLVLDKTTELQKELSSLQSELDRIQYLLKIADPTGEAARKRDSKAQMSKSIQPDVPVPNSTERLPLGQKRSSILAKAANGSRKDEYTLKKETDKPSGGDEPVSNGMEGKEATYTVTKPIWLGAIEDMEVKENQHEEVPSNVHEVDQFVDYKDRKKALATENEAKKTLEPTIEDAGPGLIVRKRKQMEKPGDSNEEVPEVSTSVLAAANATAAAADAVALLLKHKRGYYGGDEEDKVESHDVKADDQSGKEKPTSKRVLGPERPVFLDRRPESETWVPPEGSGLSSGPVDSWKGTLHGNYWAEVCVSWSTTEDAFTQQDCSGHLSSMLKDWVGCRKCATSGKCKPMKLEVL